MRISRRTLLRGTAAAGLALAAPAVPRAQGAPFKLGLLTVKTGPLAQGGIQMEQGVLTFLKERDNMMGGRKVDFVSGYEQMGGFQAAFQKEGGCVVNKLWPPIVTPDYTPYIAQISDCDGICQGFAGSNPPRFMKGYADGRVKYPE